MSKYYVLTGYNVITEEFEIVFGDYDKELVKDELEYERHNLEYDYKRLRISALQSDSKQVIDGFVEGLRL